MSSSRLMENLPRELFVLEDEDNPHGSRVDTIWPSTVLDQVYDNLSPTKKTLRQIIEELRQEILSGGRGNIVFPVTSVNGMTEDVNITAKTIGLDNVDNTRDSEKPLSEIQRQAVMEMLRDYDFNVNMQEFYDHLSDNTNPHGVTLEMLNKENNLEVFIGRLVEQHNTCTKNTIHSDIRRNLSTLWNLVDSINNGLDDRIGGVLSSLDEHYQDENAHMNLLMAKENNANKVRSFWYDTADYEKYPSTQAVVEHVTNRLTEFKDTLPPVENWIDDITVVDTRDDVPKASARNYRKACFVRYSETSKNEVGICRLTVGGNYEWDFYDLGTYSKFDPEYFVDGTTGMSLNFPNVIRDIISNKTLVDEVDNIVRMLIPEIMKDYPTFKDINDMGIVRQLKFLPGTQDGTFRYYTNNDESTMSEDVPIAGLKRLAYLEWVTENQLWDQSVHSRHILSRAVESRHINEQAVVARHLSAGYMNIFGNISDENGRTVSEIPISDFGRIISTYIHLGDNIDVRAAVINVLKQTKIVTEGSELYFLIPEEHELT